MRDLEPDKVLLIASALIAVLLLGLAGTLWKLLGDFGVLTIWQVLALTTPMTLAVAIIAGLGFSDEHLSLLAVLGIVVVTAGITVLIGLHSARPVQDVFSLKSCSFNLYHASTYNSCVENSSPDSLPDVVLRLVGAYWKVYGWRLFASSIVAGTALGFLAVVSVPRYLSQQSPKRRP